MSTHSATMHERLSADALRRWPCQSCGYDLRPAVDRSSDGTLRCSECGRETTVDALYHALTSTSFVISKGWAALALLPGPIGGVFVAFVTTRIIPIDERWLFEINALAILYMFCLALFATRYAPSARIRLGRAALLTLVLGVGNLAFYSLFLLLGGLIAQAWMGMGQP